MSQIRELTAQEASYSFLKSLTDPNYPISMEIKTKRNGVPNQLIFTHQGTNNKDSFTLSDLEDNPRLTNFHFWALQNLDDPKLRLTEQQKAELSNMINLLAYTIWNDHTEEMPALFENTFLAGFSYPINAQKNYGILSPKDTDGLSKFLVTAATGIDSLKAIIREREMLQQYDSNDLFGHDLGVLYMPSKRSNPISWHPGEKVPKNIILSAVGLEKSASNYNTFVTEKDGKKIIHIQADNPVDYFTAINQVHKMLQEHGNGVTLRDIPFEVSFEKSRVTYGFWQSEMNVSESLGEDILKAYLEQQTGIHFHDPDINGDHPISFESACYSLGISVLAEDLEKVRTAIEQFQKNYPMIYGSTHFDVVGVP